MNRSIYVAVVLVVAVVASLKFGRTEGVDPSDDIDLVE